MTLKSLVLLVISPRTRYQKKYAAASCALQLQQLQKELSADNENDQWPSKANKVIVKAVFGKLVMRDEAVAVLKKRFNVQQKHLTGLVPGQLYAVMAKKLVQSKYCTLLNKQNIKNLKRSDLTFAKEIEI